MGRLLQGLLSLGQSHRAHLPGGQGQPALQAQTSERGSQIWEADIGADRPARALRWGTTGEM